MSILSFIDPLSISNTNHTFQVVICTSGGIAAESWNAQASSGFLKASSRLCYLHKDMLEGLLQNPGMLNLFTAISVSAAPVAIAAAASCGRHFLSFCVCVH